MQLAIYVDAAHATDVKTHRSISGMVATLNGTAISFQSKLQPTVTTISTEVELIAAVSTGKTCKFLSYFLNELGMLHTGPTAIYKDNAAAILIANSGKPTERSRHIDT